MEILYQTCITPYAPHFLLVDCLWLRGRSTRCRLERSKLVKNICLFTCLDPTAIHPSTKIIGLFIEKQNADERLGKEFYPHKTTSNLYISEAATRSSARHCLSGSRNTADHHDDADDTQTDNERITIRRNRKKTAAVAAACLMHEKKLQI